jgi:excisionase family DNA binding protein
LEQLLVGVLEAAEALGLSPWTIRKYVRSGRIRGVRIGRRVLIEPRELERLIECGQMGRDAVKQEPVVKGITK